MFINVSRSLDAKQRTRAARAYRGPGHYQHYRNRYRIRCIRNCKDNEAADFLDIFIAAARRGAARVAANGKNISP